MITVDEKTLSELDPVVADHLRQHGLQSMGVEATYTYWDDPKRMAWSLSRYKFVSKMMEGRKNVFEAGCADGFSSRIVSQAVGHLTAVDIVGAHVESARKTAAGKWPITFLEHDMLSGPVAGSFDGAFSLDVLEHIEPHQEEVFVSNLIANLTPHGLCIVGMPSLQSQAYASRLSKQNHINCKDQKVLKGLFDKYFHTVLTFASNDEIIHTGYHQMSHYNIVVCAGKK